MNELIKRIDNFISKQNRFIKAKKTSLPSKPPGISSGGQKSTFPGKSKKLPAIKKPEGILGEVATQLTPKGPGYHSPQEIASDIRESGRLARKIIKPRKPEKPKLPETTALTIPEMLE